MLSLIAVAVVLVQSAPQNPSPMVDTTRPHPRIAESPRQGRRAPLTLGTLYLSPRFKPAPRVPLVVHFHGSAWLIEHHAARQLPRAALVTVQLGAGSSAYARPFSSVEAFDRLVDEASTAACDRQRPCELSPIVLTAFSAGYGAIRAILQHPSYHARVAAVLLADSLHAGYTGTIEAIAPRDVDAALDRIDAANLEALLRFAREAVAGRKAMWVTHSEVYPGTFASTTETADYLLRALQIVRRPALKQGPVGMQQLSEAGRGRFRVLGFAGNSGPDHMDHLYAIGRWFALLRDGPL